MVGGVISLVAGILLAVILSGEIVNETRVLGLPVKATFLVSCMLLCLVRSAVTNVAALRVDLCEGRKLHLLLSLGLERPQLVPFCQDVALFVVLESVGVIGGNPCIDIYRVKNLDGFFEHPMHFLDLQAILAIFNR